jgi:hypothetical protein
MRSKMQGKMQKAIVWLLFDVLRLVNNYILDIYEMPVWELIQVASLGWTGFATSEA